MAENKEEEEIENSVEEDPSIDYEKKRLSFISDLKRFNASRGTPFDRVPDVAGIEIDLYHLYQRVTALGGWQKVNLGELWENFVEDFGLPSGCVNATQALKNIYFRYLNLYEKVNYLGEDPDIKDHDDEEGPARKKICLPIETIPLTYNYGQHKLTDSQRQQNNLATQLYVQKEYEKLEMSLRSGLPNEVDMAINVCVLLSTEGRHCMKLDKTHQLLRLLMAHVAVFDEDTLDMQELYYHCWMPNADRNFLRFWFETVTNRKVKPLITFGGKPYDQKEMVGNSVLNLGRDLGTLDSEGQRVLQLAVFLHNLSFEEENQKILAENYLVYKFLMLSLYSSYNGVRQIALDTLANLSCEIVVERLKGNCSQLLLDMLNEALLSEDRFFLVRGMETLGKLSQLACNEELLLEQLHGDTFKRLIDLLTVQDIQLIVHTLETLYRLSKIGDPFTTRIARVHKAISILVSLVTIEAQSFGPGSLVGIKVVEYIPPARVGADGDVDNVQKPTTVIQPINPDSINIYQVPAGSSLSVGLSNNPDKNTAIGKPAEAPKPPPPPPTDIHATTSSWLNATYELKKRSKVNQVELFSEYLQFCRKFAITNAMSSADFLHLVKVIFHQCEVMSINRKNGENDVFLEGLVKRSQQKPFAVTTLPPEKVRNPVSVNVSPKQAQAHPVDSLSHTPTLRQRLMEPPRVSLSPQRYLHPGASSQTPSSTAAVATPKSTQPVNNTKGGRPAPSQSSKGTSTPQGKPVKTAMNKTQPNQTGTHHLEAAIASRPSASQTHPSIQQALQHESVGEPQSVKTLLAKKLSQTGTSEVDRPHDTSGVNTNFSNGPAGGSFLSSRVVTQPNSRIQNIPSDSLVQNNAIVSSAGTSQTILVHSHSSTASSSSLSSSSASSGAVPMVQQSHNATTSLGNVILGQTLTNTVGNQNTMFHLSGIQQKAGVRPVSHINQNSNVMHTNSSQPATLNNAQTFITNPQLTTPQQNGPSVGVLPPSQCQQQAQIQVRPSLATTMQTGMVPQNQIQNGPYQINSSLPVPVVQHQQSSGGLVPGNMTVPSGAILRNPAPGVVIAGQQQQQQPLPNPMVVQSAVGASVTQAISSPAVAALLTSNSQQSSQVLISNAGNQAQVVARPALQQQQQVPTTVVIQTPPGTIVMPSRQGQGGTVSFIVPSQYRQGTPVTFIQQHASAATTSGLGPGINMLQSQGQQRQIVIASPRQTSIPVGMQLSSIQGHTVIRNQATANPAQQQNLVIQASSPLLPSTSAAASSSIPQLVPQLPPTPESQLVRSEPSVVNSQTNNIPLTVNQPQQQMQCNGLNHDQNGIQNPPDLLANGLPPSPITQSDKEGLNGTYASVGKEQDQIKGLGNKLDGKMNGVVHTFTEQIREGSPLANVNSHVNTLVNGSLSVVNQQTNIVGQGLQVRLATGVIANGSAAPTTGQAVHLGNGIYSQQQSQQQLPLQLQQPHQVVINQPQQQQLPQQPSQLASQVRQQLVQTGQPQGQLVSVHQGPRQPLQSQNSPQQGPIQHRVVSVRPAQPAQSVIVRPHISTLPSATQQHQPQQTALHPGPQPASLPISGSVPTGEAGSNNTVKDTTVNEQTMIGQSCQTPTPVSASTRKKLPPRPVKNAPPPVPSTPDRLRNKRKPGPNEIVVTPGSVQTRKQTQGQRPVHIAMQYMCEWGSCRKCFSTARLVLIHVFKQHVPKQDSSCQWIGCEKLIRKRWSLISHIQDHHCSEMAMRAACQRRYTAIQTKAAGGTPAPPPTPPTPMIYPPDAAMQAIRRFSVKQPYAEFADPKEGPVSKHIRLTSALILRNICNSSSLGRRLVRQHEEVLSYNTMNVVEASTALSHCLWDIAQCCDKDPHSLSS